MNDQAKIDFAEKWLEKKQKNGSQLAIAYLNLIQNAIVPLRNSYLLTLFSLIEGSEVIIKSMNDPKIHEQISKNRN
jgi:hypothetical protein